MGYDYTIQYTRGKENQGADALSRVTTFQFLAISLPVANWWSTLKHEVQHHPYFTYLSNSPNYVQRDGVWLRNGKIVLCPNSTLLQAVLAKGHLTPLNGHFGFHKTLSRF